MKYKEITSPISPILMMEFDSEHFYGHICRFDLDSPKGQYLFNIYLKNNVFERRGFAHGAVWNLSLAECLNNLQEIEDDFQGFLKKLHEDLTRREMRRYMRDED